MIPAVMKGVQLLGHGGPEKLVWNESIPTPAPKAGEVLVRVLAAGVNNTDINTRVGWYAKEVSEATEESAGDSAVEAGGWSGALSFPLIQGADLCGEVVALGEGVEDPALGARVTCPTNQPEPTAEQPTRFQAIGSEFDGAFAQYCRVPAKQLYDVSASPLSDVEIAAMPCAFGTALNLLTRAGVGEGDRVLVTGASGGVGMAAVALASLKGAVVTGIAKKEKHPQVLEAGARSVLDRGEFPAENHFDVVIDLVGGPDWPKVLEALSPAGRYAVSGAIAGPVVTADLRTIYLKDLTLYGCTYTPPEVFGELVGLINEGALRPLIARTYSLSEIGQAQRDFLEKKEPGKLVLLPPS
ncbi:alcohol dehydrogenase family protein [Limibacillus halophilus]